MERLNEGFYSLFTGWPALITIVLAVYIEYFFQTLFHSRGKIVVTNRRFRKRSGIYAASATKQVRQVLSGRFYQQSSNCENLHQENNPDSFLDSVRSPEGFDETSKVCEPIKANIYLKGGETIQVNWEDSDAYIKANPDKVEYRRIKTRRPRIKD